MIKIRQLRVDPRVYLHKHFSYHFNTKIIEIWIFAMIIIFIENSYSKKIVKVSVKYTFFFNQLQKIIKLQALFLLVKAKDITKISRIYQISIQLSRLRILTMLKLHKLFFPTLVRTKKKVYKKNFSSKPPSCNIFLVRLKTFTCFC